MYGALAMSSLGEWLKTELASRQWTQSYAAEQLGLPLQTLNDIINKPKKDPSPLTLRKIADGLSVSLELLFEQMGHGAKAETPQEGRAMPEAVRGLSKQAYQQLLDMSPDELDRYLNLLAEQRRRGAGR